MRTATGIEICAYVNFESHVATPGHELPTSVPAPMQSATHSERYRSKTPIRFLAVLVLDSAIVESPFRLAAGLAATIASAAATTTVGLGLGKHERLLGRTLVAIGTRRRFGRLGTRLDINRKRHRAVSTPVHPCSHRVLLTSKSVNPMSPRATVPYRSTVLNR